MDTLVLWHGTRSSKPMEIPVPRPGEAEHGAAVYLCAHLRTARQYAAGGGRVLEVRVRPTLRLVRGMTVSAQELVDVAKTIPRLRRREAILADLHRCARYSRDGSTVGLETLLNLAHAHGALSGQPAVAISEFMASRGADALLHTHSNGDDWLAVFNPKRVIVSARTRPLATIELAEWERPRIQDQIDACARHRATVAKTIAQPRERSSPGTPR